MFPFDLVELVPSLSLVYIYSPPSRIHEVGKREAAFKTKITTDPSATFPGILLKTYPIFLLKFSYAF
jgi:hypothetical protein